MKPAHTPGPWRWDGHSLLPCNPDYKSHAVHTILEADNFAWGFVSSKLEDVLPEDEANRALIAAAPELLEALTFAEQFMSGFEGDAAQDGIDAKLTTIRIALSKARNAITNATEVAA